MREQITDWSDSQLSIKFLVCPCDFVIFCHSIFDIRSSHHLSELLLPLKPSFPIDTNFVLPSSDSQSPTKCLMCAITLVIRLSFFVIRYSINLSQSFPNWHSSSRHQFQSKRNHFSPQATANLPVSALLGFVILVFSPFDIQSSHNLSCLKSQTNHFSPQAIIPIAQSCNSPALLAISAGCGQQGSHP